MNQNNIDEDRRDILLEKFKQGIITRSEAEELKISLEQEKAQASSRGNIVLVLGIAILLGLLIKYLEEQKVIDLNTIKKLFSRK